MKKTVFIEGMTCKNCVRHVKEALEELEGIQSVNVSLEGKSAEIELAHIIDDEKIKSAVYDAGYDVTSIEG